jgi:hypothetical protein
MSTFWWYQPSSGPLPQTCHPVKGSEVVINPSAKTNPMMMLSFICSFRNKNEPKGDVLIAELHKDFHVK